MNRYFWQYDEFRQIGTDYNSKAEVEIYDSRHGEFRDIEAENNKILDAIGLKEGELLIDFGSGTGTFAIQAAKRSARVHAVDVSRPMIDCAAAKAAEAGIANIEFHHAGFLTYDHRDAPADAVVTTFAFHHLPDFWKGVALQRVNGMLKPGGRLYLRDVILEETNALAHIAAFIDKLATAGGKRLQEDSERHFRDEYSTYDWVMDGLLSRTGFTIESKQMEAGVIGTYLCAKR